MAEWLSMTSLHRMYTAKEPNWPQSKCKLSARQPRHSADKIFAELQRTAAWLAHVWKAYKVLILCVFTGRQAQTMANASLKQIFKDLHARITKDVNPDSVIDTLVSKNIISDDEFCELRRVADRRDRCRDLLSLLYRSSHPETFVQLRLALAEDFPAIVDEIDQRISLETDRLQQLGVNQATVDGQTRGLAKIPVGLSRQQCDNDNRK